MKLVLENNSKSQQPRPTMQAECDFADGLGQLLGWPLRTPARRPASCCARTNDGREYPGRSGGIDSGTEQRVKSRLASEGLNRPREVSALVRSLNILPDGCAYLPNVELICIASNQGRAGRQTAQRAWLDRSGLFLEQQPVNRRRLDTRLVRLHCAYRQTRLVFS